MTEPAPRSTRHPWIRSGLMGLLPFLLPFVWVLEIESCGNAPTATEITGSMVIGKVKLEGWLIMVPVLIAVMITPWVANLVRRVGARALVHLLGLVAAGLAGFGAFFGMFFTIFTDRAAKGVGWVVLAAFVASLVDALLRVVWSTQEWLAARAALKTASK